MTRQLTKQFNLLSKISREKNYEKNFKESRRDSIRRLEEDEGKTKDIFPWHSEN